MSVGRSLSWLRPALPGSEVDLRLVCFPPAGGGAASFFGWRQGVPATCEVVGVDLPPEATATGRTPRQRIDDVAVRLADELLTRCGDRPFAFYGHSAGAIVSYELTRELRRRGEALPLRMFVSGRRAPHLPLVQHRTLYDLSEPDLVAAIADMGGGGERMASHPKWRERLLPDIRAHLEISDCYQYRDEDPLPCPLHVYCGENDSLVAEPEWRAWQDHTAAASSAEALSGRHFFDPAGHAALLDRISAALAPHLASVPGDRASTSLEATT